jgi:hypothetical protein
VKKPGKRWSKKSRWKKPGKKLIMRGWVKNDGKKVKNLIEKQLVDTN